MTWRLGEEESGKRQTRQRFAEAGEEGLAVTAAERTRSLASLLEAGGNGIHAFRPAPGGEEVGLSALVSALVRGPREEHDENMMSVAETIFERAKSLPDELQTEALHYVDYLVLRRQAEMEDGEWVRHSAAQLLAQYAAEDAIYDEGK